MITKEDALQQFKNIVGTKASWANLLKSQFLNHFSIFMSWALRQALWVVERVFQEIFLSTAVNESSVRAHAEDREYFPRKAVPASGTVNIANKGEYPVVIPAGTSFFSDTNEFLAEDPVSIAAVGNKDANVRQATPSDFGACRFRRKAVLRNPVRPGRHRPAGFLLGENR